MKFCTTLAVSSFTLVITHVQMSTVCYLKCREGLPDRLLSASRRHEK